MQKRHHRPQSRFLLEPAVAGVNIHGFQHIRHLLLAPHQLLVAFGGYGDKDGKIKQILVLVGDPVLYVITRHDGIGEFLIICAGVLETFQFRAVQSDSLRHLIDRFASIFPEQKDVHIYAFPSVNEGGHPAAPDHAWIPVLLDI